MEESGNGIGGNGVRGDLPGFDDLAVKHFSRDSEDWDEQEELLSELEETACRPTRKRKGELRP